MMVIDSKITQVVQDRYSSIALGTSANCCGTESCGTGCSDDSSATLYDTATLAGLPAEVTDISLGCGDPVAIADLKAGEVVLDLGSGGGIDCFLAARQVGESGQVIGLDMTAAMIERANANKQRMGVENVEFRLGQIEAMPVADDSVDIVISNCVINLVPDKSKAFSEAFRVLKPGGRVSFSDIVTEGEFSAEMHADTARWAECVTGAIDVETYVDAMRAAGFTAIEVRDKTNAEEIVTRQEGMPRLFSARITARKPL